MQTNSSSKANFSSLIEMNLAIENKETKVFADWVFPEDMPFLMGCVPEELINLETI